MGINRLAELIRERAAGAITSKSIYAYEGSVMALDAAVVMNQFRMARPDRRYLHHLSQIVGVFYRTASLLEKGIKPVFVFDGPAPRMKSRVLRKRQKWKADPLGQEHTCGPVPESQEHACGQVPGNQEHACDQVPGGQEHACGQVPGNQEHACGQVPGSQEHACGSVPESQEHACGQIPESLEHACGQVPDFAEPACKGTQDTCGEMRGAEGGPSLEEGSHAPPGGTEQREKRKGEQNTAAALDGKVPVESFVRNGRQDCQRLLTLLGVPYIEAPGEAEATCAALVRAGLVHCTATEDMDALPFGCSRLVRHVTASPHARVEEFSLPAVLQALQLSHEQFVDLCILLGCDYCDKIHGVGPGRALPLLQQHHSLDGVVQHLRPGRLAVPEDWPYREARRLFLQPAVTDPGGVTLEWGAPDEEGLVQLLVHEKHAKERRVRSRIQRLRESLREVERRSRMFTAERQQRLDDFYSRVGALRYRRQGDEPHFKLPKTRRRIARRNLSHPPLRRRPHPRTCPPAPSTALPAGPENLPVTLPLA
ncbi:flap endonuclease 1 isoform X1 [Amblyraja radiata]|uniref:flap endonuclease 1 isoform X1 n=2 Tax=Amblyraja radiata TaxID=386614 RepID=UPI001403158B|nr:flap endonuclease 1 isoform X1 [Amblyraja radiata]